MSKKKDDEVRWVSAKYGDYIGYQDIADVIKKLQEALEAEQRGEWKNLHLDYDYAPFNESERLFIMGSRPENEAERIKREVETKRTEDFQRNQYEILKAKFEPNK